MLTTLVVVSLVAILKREPPGTFIAELLLEIIEEFLYPDFDSG